MQTREPAAGAASAPLTANDAREIETASAQAHIQGDRYPGTADRSLNTEGKAP